MKLTTPQKAGIAAAVIVILFGVTCGAAQRPATLHQLVSAIDRPQQVAHIGVISATEPRTSPDPPRPVHHARRASTRSAPASPAPAPIRHTRVPSPPIHSGGLHGLVCSYGWSCAIATCVVSHESRWNPHAYNPSGAAGLFQLMPLWYRGHWHFDPFNAWSNTHYAHELYQMYGWSPWHGDPCV